MSNALKTAGKVVGMKRGGSHPQQPMYDAKHAKLDRAMKFLGTHKKANAPKAR